MIFERLLISIYCAVLFFCITCADFDVGDAINILEHYGVLAQMLPVGTEDPDRFIETAFTKNIFKKNEIANRRQKYKGDWTEGIWKMTLCERVDQLLDTFFDNYEAEFIERNEKLLFSTWKYHNLEVLFGIQQYYLMNDYLFLLIKHEKYLTHITLDNLPDNATMYNEQFLRVTENITGEPLSEYQLFRQFGTHFTRSFSIGDVIFQLLVYPKGAMECFKLNKFNNVIGVTNKCAISSIVHAGKIRTLSNTPEMENALNEMYNKNSTTSKYHNLLHLRLEKKEIPEDILKLSNYAITALKLSGINNAILNQNKSSHVKEFLVNQMSLRDIYI